MIALEAFLATIGIAMILVISLSVIIAGVRSEWPMFLGAFGYHPPRARTCPPKGTPAAPLAFPPGEKPAQPVVGADAALPVSEFTA